MVWRPQGDSNPRYRRERAMSWASGRWGRNRLDSYYCSVFRRLASNAEGESLAYASQLHHGLVPTNIRSLRYLRALLARARVPVDFYQFTLIHVDRARVLPDIARVVDA